jgi:hypothetical protein
MKAIGLGMTAKYILGIDGLCFLSPLKIVGGCHAIAANIKALLSVAEIEKQKLNYAEKFI